MANTASQVETWSSFYDSNKEEIPTLQAAYEMSFKTYDTMTQALNQLGEELVVRMATLPHNFVLLPGSSNQGKILLLHHCFTVSEPGERPILVGVNGNRYSSPFKAFDPDEATARLKPPTAITQTPRISTRSKPAGSESKHFIPTLRQFLEVEYESDFQALAGNDNGEEVETLAEWPTSFLLHPEVFACLEGIKEIRAREAAIVIIKAIVQAYDPAKDGDAQRNGSSSSHDNSNRDESQEADITRNGLELSAPATGCYRLLVFLWAISNAMGTKVETDDPPESKITDARMILTRQELMPAIRPAPAQPSGIGGFATDPATMPALVQNLNAMTEHALRTAKREEHETSMISRLSSEQSELFTLLSAKDWHDYKPELSGFAKQLLADRDPFKAMNLITSETRGWRGTVGRRGITQFFCMGYAATDIETQPGGFTIFMFRPKNATQPLSQAALKQLLRHLLGDTKVDDDTVVYFAQNDFYLPDSIDRLEVQLQTCIQFLDLITAEKGIASEGYSEGLRLLRDNRQAFETVQAKDDRFSIKVAYLLDRIFQSFVNQLARHRSSPTPIRSAKRRLKNLQEDDVNEALRQIRFGIAPAIHLPASISDPSSSSPRQTDRSNRTDDRSNRTDDRSNRPDDRKKSAASLSDRAARKPESNSNVIEDWKVPTGKRYGDFFNPVKFPENTKGWPKFLHHNPDKPRQAALCMRFQCDGKCHSECNFSHVDPYKIPKPIKDEITSRLHLIFS
jgi:hypothetical protein